MEESQGKTSSTDVPVTGVDNQERVKNEPQGDRGTRSGGQWKRDGKEKGYSNQRGTRGSNVQHPDDLRAGGDSNRFRNNQSKPNDRGYASGRPERQSGYRGNRESRSTQDKNWRNDSRRGDIAAAASSVREENQQAKTSDTADKHRRRYPDREIYQPRSMHWSRDDDRSSDQSRSHKKTDSFPPHQENRQRRTDNRSRFRSGRDFQDHKENVENKDSGKEGSDDKSSDVERRKPEQGKDNYSRGRRRYSNNTRNRVKSTTDEEKEKLDSANQNKSDANEKSLHNKNPSEGDGYGSTGAEKQANIGTDSKYVDADSASPHVNININTTYGSQDSTQMPGLRRSPTMGIDHDKNIGEAVYSGGDMYPSGPMYPGGVVYPGGPVFPGQVAYGSEVPYGGVPAYANVPMGVNAFGVYYNPYDAPYNAYGGQSGNTEFAAEVSIGRGARWNEWYHNIWNGPPPEHSMYAGERYRGDANRGFVPNRGRPGRGSRYHDREGRMKDKHWEQNRPQDNQSDHYNKQQEDTSGKSFHADGSRTASKSDNQHQPGFSKRGRDKAKGGDKPVKAKSGKQYRGSSETQTGTLIEQLTDGTYECLVCCDVIKCEARVWSCGSCYNVFHLKCIKEWAKSPAAASEDSDGWKCPACRHVTVHIPYVYKCFCGKTRDPEWQPGDTPHSCGEVCRRKRPNTSCTHSCKILCHPGPCPQCPANVKKSCVCGKTKETVRCGAVPVLRCQKACGKLLNCALHVCEQVCHADKCEDCQEKIVQGCYCGKNKREIFCGSIPDAEEGPENFSCEQECGKELSCGNHSCNDPCHEGDCDPCPLSPERVKYCPCGQTPLDKLIELEDGKERTKCTDPIPTCQKTCGKPLVCGGDNVHTCKQECHEGDCGPCPDISMVRCRCGHRYIDIPCADLTADSVTNPHLCDRKCTKRKSCGKHRCQQKCCVDTEHKCTQICNRKLNCGIHVCEANCHPGNCIRCLEASFEELFCHCGASVLMPPIPCGTKPPECTQECARRHDCDHPVRHTCHSEETCPPCADLTSKMCMGGHELRHNLPCYIEDVSCGNPCGKPLPCKQHTCQKTCHRGFCGRECSQPCPLPRPDCGHPCNAPCHPDTACPRQRCKAKVTIKCACGHLSETSQCLQGVDDSQLTEAFQKMTRSAMAAQLKFGQSSVDITQLMAFRDDKGQRVLECTEECARIERNRRFADALNIKDADLLGSAAPNYITFLKEQARKNPAFVSSVEKDFAAVVKAVQSKYTSRTHAFAPMNRDQRRVIHELSDFYGLESQSYDQEPKRNVVVTARRDKCYVPSVTLSAMVQQELHPKAPTPIPHNRIDDIRDTAGKHGATVLKKKKSEEEIVDYFEMT